MVNDQLSSGSGAAAGGGLPGVGGGAGGGGIASHPLYYYSTHNALRAAEGGENFFPVTFVELHGKRSCKINVYPFCDVQMVKRILLKKMNLSSCMQVRDIRLLYKGSELPNWRLMNIFTDAPFKKLHWSIRSDHLRASLRPLVSQQKLHRNLVQVIEEVKLGFRRNVAPKLTMDGTGGTYILFDARRRPVGIFKPEDEEAFAPCNPRGYEGRIGQAGFRGGVLSGEGAGREYAAHILDSLYHSYAGVPPTTMVEACHPAFCYKSPVQLSTGDHLMMDSYMSSSINPTKSSLPAASQESGGQQQLKWKAGSLQQFAQAKESCGDYNPLLFSVSDVHRIAIFDIRVMNLDRNDGNILVAPLHTFQDITAALNYSDGPSLHEVPGRLAQHQQKMLAQQLASKLIRSVSSIGCVGRTSCNDEAAAQAAADAAQAAQALVTPDGQHTKFRLVPIDHGLILPDVIDVATFDLVWFDWPHCKIPFCEQEVALIYSFNAERDAERLRRRLLMRDDCLRTLRLSTRFLQQCVRHHLNLYQIATIAARSDVDKPSALELLVRTSLERAYLTMDCASLVSTNRLGFGMLDLAELKEHHDSMLFSTDCKQGSSSSGFHYYHYHHSSSSGVYPHNSNKTHRQSSKGSGVSSSRNAGRSRRHHTEGKGSSSKSGRRGEQPHEHHAGRSSREKETSSSSSSLADKKGSADSAGAAAGVAREREKEEDDRSGRLDRNPREKENDASLGNRQIVGEGDDRRRRGGQDQEGTAEEERSLKEVVGKKSNSHQEGEKGLLLDKNLPYRRSSSDVNSQGPTRRGEGEGSECIRQGAGEEERRRSSLDGEPQTRIGGDEREDEKIEGSMKKVMDSASSSSSSSSCSCEDDEDENEDDLRCGAGRVLRASCTTTFSSLLGSRRSSSSYRWYGSGSNKGGVGTGSEGSSPGISRDTSGRSSLLAASSAGGGDGGRRGMGSSTSDGAASDHTYTRGKLRIPKEPAVCTPGCAAAVVVEEEESDSAGGVSELDEQQAKGLKKTGKPRDSWDEEEGDNEEDAEDSRRSPSVFTSSETSSDAYYSSTTSMSSWSEEEEEDEEEESSLEVSSSLSGHESDTERESLHDKSADASGGEKDPSLRSKTTALGECTSGDHHLRGAHAMNVSGPNRQRGGKASGGGVGGGLSTSASAPGLTSLPSAAFFDYPPNMMNNTNATASAERRKESKRRKKKLDDSRNNRSVKREDGGEGESRDIPARVGEERRDHRRKSSRRKRHGVKNDLAAKKKREGEGESKPPEEEQNVFAAVRGTQRGTVRRLNGTAAGSAYRRRKQQPHGVGSTWILYDMDGRSIPLDWSEPRFDRLFFECFEELLRKYIQQQHPEWPSYPYHGSRLDAQMKREREALEKKIRQQKEAAANAAANAAASAAQTAPGVGTPTPHPPSQTTFSSSSFPSSHSDGLPRKSLSQGKIGPGDPSRGSLSPRDHRSVPLQSSSSSTGRILDPARWMSSSASSSSSSSHRTAKEGEEWTSSTPAATKGRERPNREAFSSSQNQGSTATRATRFAAG